MGTPSIIVFDVNETLIDIESIGPFSRENSATGKYFANGSIS